MGHFVMKMVFGGGHEILYKSVLMNGEEQEWIERQIITAYTAIHVMMNTGVLCQIYYWGES